MKLDLWVQREAVGKQEVVTVIVDEDLMEVWRHCCLWKGGPPCEHLRHSEIQVVVVQDDLGAGAKTCMLDDNSRCQTVLMLAM